jgi:hypothetical protein
VHIVDAVSVRGKFDSVNPRSSAVEKFCAFVVHLIRPPFPNRFENFSEISIRFILRVFADGHQTPSFPGMAAVWTFSLHSLSRHDFHLRRPLQNRLGVRCSVRPVAGIAGFEANKSRHSLDATRFAEVSYYPNTKPLERKNRSGDCFELGIAAPFRQPGSVTPEISKHWRHKCERRQTPAPSSRKALQQTKSPAKTALTCLCPKV